MSKLDFNISSGFNSVNKNIEVNVDAEIHLANTAWLVVVATVTGTAIVVYHALAIRIHFVGPVIQTVFTFRRQNAQVDSIIKNAHFTYVQMLVINNYLLFNF